ncbi:LOW QUALITY PROTEIN: trypsinogen-like protein 3 [Xenentodon cancila]
MNVLLLAVALGLAGASPLEDNRECQLHSPWHVRLQGGGVSCSGALIDKCLVVPVYHCAPRAYSTVASPGEQDKSVAEGTEQHIQNDGSAVMVCGDQLQGPPWRHNGCRNPADPSVYAKLCRYNGWINGVMSGTPILRTMLHLRRHFLINCSILEETISN